VAYQSDESGQLEIYVRRFPDADGLQEISVNGGVHPKWSPKGDELFYVNSQDNHADGGSRNAPTDLTHRRPGGGVSW
jgi:Tol biopolymer transport system component